MIQPTAALAEFIRIFEASLDPRLWVKLVKEEVEEFNVQHHVWLETRDDQDKADLLKEAADVMYVATAFHLLMAEGENLYRFLLSPEEWNDWELTAIEANNVMKMATAIFSAELLGQAFVRVHQSNLSKLSDDGKPLRRRDGKILKGPNYQPPVLIDLVQ